ncbi:MAG: response regulator [Gammaproteobacteria bacterium]|nr:response regulator [Gammaproteobacteria bacterium]
MAVLEEKYTVLETAVAEVVNILFEILAEENPDNEVVTLPDKLGRYAQQVERVGMAAEEAGFMGLRDLCILFQEKLGELAELQRPLWDDERMLLEEWPTLVVGYMESPDDPAARDGLIQHLQNPAWVTPLAQEDAEVMKSLYAAESIQENLWDTQATEATPAIEEAPASQADTPDEYIPVPAENVVTSSTPPADSDTTQIGGDAAFPANPDPVPDSQAMTPVAYDDSTEPLQELLEEPTTGPVMRYYTPDNESTLPAQQEQSFWTQAEPSSGVATTDVVMPPDSTTPSQEETGGLLSSGSGTDPEQLQRLTESESGETAENLSEAPSLLFADSDSNAPPAIDRPDERLQTSVADVQEQPPSEPSDILQAPDSEGEAAQAQSTPETEVARLLIVLESLASSHDDTPATVTPEDMTRYANQVERIGLTAGAQGQWGLQDVCLLLNMNLETLSARGEPLANVEFESLLATWPILAMDYLNAPADPETSQALVTHLQHSVWPTPLETDEARVLTSVLMSNVGDMKQAHATAEPSPEPAQSPSSYSEILPEQHSFTATESDQSKKQYLSEPSDVEQADRAGDSGFAEESESSGLISESDDEPVAEVSEASESAGFLSEGDDEPATEVNQAREVEETEAIEDEDETDTAESVGVNPELLEILAAEIAQMEESVAEMLATISSEQSDVETRRETLSTFAEEIERLADASEAVGLAGMNQVCAHVQANILELAAQERPLTDDEQAVIAGWPTAVSAYLGGITDLAACQSLTQYLQDGRWPNPWPAEESVTLTEQLAAPVPVAEEMMGEARQEIAAPEDVSLALPEDVNPELLDSLLQELPGQTAELSAAVQRLAQGDGGLDDVDVAQRIAHTVKGAGNTVGVRGIATLTHHMEDILLAFSKHKTLPTRALSETLLNATDCLETMSEALLGMSAPPTQALNVLQEILDWANRIDREGIPAEDDQAPTPRKPVAVPVPTTAGEEETASTAAEHAAAPMLRVPATLVDDLLRLVGESIILTGQIQERVRKTMGHARSVQEQNLAFQQLTAELEQLVDVRGITSPLTKITRPGKGNFDPLELEQYNELNTVTHRLLEVANDSQELSLGVEGDLTALDTLLVDQGRLHRESQEAVLRTRMVPVKTIVPRLQRSVRQTCRLTDKEAELLVKGSDTLIDSNVLNDMTDPLMHILRNAVDHGIESPDIRQAQNKNPVGRIHLSFFREGNAIVVRCQDDGAGLSLPAIRQAAEQKGLINPGKVLSDEELSRLILAPGFSTRSEVTQTSGRGIGMDMVYSRIQQIKGSLNIASKAGQGCTIELRLPVTLISTHALLVRIRNQLYAISDRGIGQILYSGIGKFQKLGTTTTYHIDNDIYELSSLEELLKLPPDRRIEDRSVRPLLLVHEESGAVRAVLVEELVDSRDLVVKSMGPYIPKMRGIVGATILGDGSVAPVLDLPDLLRAPISSQQAMPTPQGTQYEQQTEITRRSALIVDDSLSARRALAQFIEDAGFEVRTSKDGMEAAAIINSKAPDILLVDLEMPRMNGLELTTHVRSQEATRNLPIIMITSRSTAKHIQEAEAAGVNYYMTKPFAEDDLLGRINQLLGHR